MVMRNVRRVVTANSVTTAGVGQVQPEHCLRSLKASVSRAPAELLPVKPLIELDMVDPRFVATLDVMSGLDHRPNLMELTPTEFEGLITELFAHMGLDTRQTRPSRDGGVDCVAFDPRPVFGGKVVIQAKRYLPARIPAGSPRGQIVRRAAKRKTLFIIESSAALSKPQSPLSRWV
jgi:Restriction endonuclease